MPKKSRKNKRKDKKSRKKHRRSTSKDSISRSSSSESSNSSDSSENEWVEKKEHVPIATTRDDWMSETSFVPTYSLKDLRKEQTESRKQKEEQTSLEKTAHVGRELNPYWRDGGSGLPENYKNDGKPRLLSQTTGDQGVEWLKKALRRAEEQAKDEGRSLESVAAERYGSLQNLHRMISEAESRNYDRKYGWKKRQITSRSTSTRSDQYTKSCSSSSSTKFMKPSNDDRIEKNVPAKESSYHSRQRWKKQKREESPSGPESSVSNILNVDTTTDSHKADESSVLTDQEMNALAAKIVKAEIIGNKCLVEELKKKLDMARKSRDITKHTVSSSSDEVVLLTHTNVRGVTQPVRGRIDGREHEKRKKYVTHVDGERVRYFEDDEKYSLTEMFEKERMTSSADLNAEFIRLSSKTKGDRDFATDDPLTEQQISNRSKKDNSRSAIDVQRNRERTLDSCSRCLANNKLPKHLVISTGLKVYLSLPDFQSLTENHCLIAPIHHATCSTLLDEDVWEEILEYCQKLLRILRTEELDAVFFETATNFKHYPHMIIHCVPIPFETSNLAPIYFKKAILECEKEWAQNKKVVDIQKMNVRRAIPKGLPYFMVNFGLDNGFAHVIEDEKDFPRNFAQEIIGGMLDLDHSVWRKLRPDSFENQCKKVNRFRKIWTS